METLIAVLILLILGGASLLQYRPRRVVLQAKRSSPNR